MPACVIAPCAEKEETYKEREGKTMATPDVEAVLLESVEEPQPPELQDLVSVDGLITEPVLGIRMLMSSRVSHVYVRLVSRRIDT